MLGKSLFYKIVLFLVKTITHKFWPCKNDFAQFYIKLPIAWFTNVYNVTQDVFVSYRLSIQLYYNYTRLPMNISPSTYKLLYGRILLLFCAIYQLYLNCFITAIITAICKLKFKFKFKICKVEIFKKLNISNTTLLAEIWKKMISWNNWFYNYSGGSNTKRVRYSDGPKLFGLVLTIRKPNYG